MRNQTGNFIPIPVKQTKATPRPLLRPSTQRKSTSSQTERVVLIKEENLTLHPCSRISQNDGGMRRDYVKAITYINSCHRFINGIIEKNCETKPQFLLPVIPNYLPLFPHLIGKRSSKQKEKPTEKPLEKKTPRSEERKSKSSFAVKRIPEEVPIDPLPVGDCGKVAAETREISDIVKEEVQKFLMNLQEDMTKAMRKTKSEIPKHKCKNLTIVKQRLEELSKICFMQKNIESNQQVAGLALTPPPSLSPPPPPTPPPICMSEDCSVIQSDTDCEEAKKVAFRKKTLPESFCSLRSDSSDIRSDSELDLIND